MPGSDLAEIFLKEAERRLAEVDDILKGPFPSGGTPELGTLQRHAHSLKGVAGSVGEPIIEALAERIWTTIEQEKPRKAPSAAAELEVRHEFELLRQEVSRIRAHAHP